MPKKTARRQPKYLVIGKILRPHGVRGELRMQMMTDHPEHLPALERIYIGKSPDDRLQELRLKHVRFNKTYALLTIEGCSTRDQADQLRSKMAMIDINDAAPLEDGQYYLFELIGMRVCADGRDIGCVKEVLETGANDVYIVESEQYGDILVPAHQETITEIDFHSDTIRMSLPAGLLPAD